MPKCVLKLLVTVLTAVLLNASERKFLYFASSLYFHVFRKTVFLVTTLVALSMFVV